MFKTLLERMKGGRIRELGAALAELRLENEALHNTLAALLSGSGRAAFLTDVNGIIVAANVAEAERARFHSRHVIGRSVYDILFPESAGERRNQVNARITTGEPAVFEDRYGERWVQTSVYPVFNTQREVVGLAVHGTDITGLRRIDEHIKASHREKEVLLREVHHRVKNNLQIVHSLLSLQIKRSDQAEITQILKECQNRIRSISLIHQRLYRAKNLAQLDMGDYLESLTHDIERAYRANERGIAITVTTDGVSLDPDTAIPCGLIANELVSNSLKHAFRGGVEGRVAVKLEEQGERVSLKVSDNGVGLSPAPDFDHIPSLGLQLVAVLARQLNGTVSVHSSQGLTVSIVFPVSSNADGTPGVRDGRPACGDRRAEGI